MSQNIISLNFTDADLAAIDAALAALEERFQTLIDLTPDERRQLSKMGDKSESFCRQTLTVMGQNTQYIPPSVDLAEAQRDLANLDALRIRAVRLRRLLGRLDDSITALGSDVMSTALEGYALLKVLGKGTGLDALRQSISARFSRTTKAKPTSDPGSTAA